jgi:chemotaxis protein MotB
MNTYGDMVTLVLTFFVLLFSFSTIDASKWEEIVQSLSGMSVIAVPALDPNARKKWKYIRGASS